MDGYIDQNRGVYNIISEAVFGVHKTCVLWTGQLTRKLNVNPKIKRGRSAVAMPCFGTSDNASLSDVAFWHAGRRDQHPPSKNLFSLRYT
jgi:hypothetical protein